MKTNLHTSPSVDTPKQTSSSRAALLLIIAGISGCATTPVRTGEGYTLFEGIAVERFERSTRSWHYTAIEDLAHVIRYRGMMSDNAANIATENYWMSLLGHLDNYLAQVRAYKSTHEECFGHTAPDRCHIPTFDFTTFSRSDIDHLKDLLSDAIRVDTRITGQESIARRCEGTIPTTTMRPSSIDRLVPNSLPTWIMLDYLARHLQELYTFSYMRPTLLAPQSRFERR